MINNIIENWETICKILLLVWFLTRFEIIGMLLDLLKENIFTNMFKLMMTCSKCLGFWTTLIWIQDPWIAIIISIFFMVYEKTIGRWETQIKLN
jgi:hypothetical protein